MLRRDADRSLDPVGLVVSPAAEVAAVDPAVLVVPVAGAVQADAAADPAADHVAVHVVDPVADAVAHRPVPWSRTA